jgi:uncharacterized lipoprotein YmbA
MTRVASYVAAVTCLACGCASSPPLHYYTLSETATASRLSAPAEAVTVRLDRVTIPTELDRAQLIRRIDATRLQILDNDRWAAPLDDTIRRVLSGNLAARLPVNLVADPNEPSAGARNRSLTVDIQEFYGDSTCAVTLRAAWLLKPPNAQGIRETEEVRTAANATCADGGALPAAMSQALGQLSDRIAAAVANSSGSPSGSTPQAH